MGTGGLPGLYGSDVLNSAYGAAAGNPLPAAPPPATPDAAQGAQIQGAPVVSPAVLAPDAIASEIATLAQDPNTVIAVAPPGYSPQSVQSPSTFPTGGDQQTQVTPIRERTLIQRAGPAVTMAGLGMVAVGVWGQPWFVVGGGGLIFLGSYMTEP